MASFEGYFSSRDVNAQSFKGAKAEDYPHMDLDSMWSFNEQYINLQKEGGKNDLYLTVFSFDHQDEVDYEINVQQSFAPVCSPCANNEAQLPSCFCQNCVAGVGKYCSRRISQLT